MLNLKCDVELWLHSTQLSEDGKQTNNSCHTVPHRSTMNELTYQLTKQQQSVYARMSL